MSALAVFSLKSPSLLAFDEEREEELVRHNLKTLYGIKNVPCDSYMREVLDEIEPKTIRESFLAVFNEVQRGKLLQRYEFLDSYLCLLDGSQIFSSEKIYCKNCCKKEHKDGRVTYHHQILGGVLAHPDLNQVIPLCPESITKQDGHSKNDSEQNALHRFLADFRREHPKLKPIMVSDALSANAPHINELASYGYSFIITAKPEGNRTLFEWVNGIMREIKMGIGKNQYVFRYINEVPLNDTQKAPMVNFFECEAKEMEGKKVVNRSFAWVTNIKITDGNIYDLMRGGRARWKIENETFNTLKNQGYQFEHNFGHGEKNLHTVFALLMMLAFLIDQVQEAACGLFQEALKHRRTRRAFWEKIRNRFYGYYVGSWKELFESMKPGFKLAELIPNTS
jgi:hypothetical protein